KYPRIAHFDSGFPLALAFPAMPVAAGNKSFHGRRRARWTSLCGRNFAWVFEPIHECSGHLLKDPQNLGVNHEKSATDFDSSVAGNRSATAGTGEPPYASPEGSGAGFSAIATPTQTLRHGLGRLESKCSRVLRNSSGARGTQHH